MTSASSGLARSLCLLCRTAWIQAASTGAQTIEPPHVQAAIEQVPGAAGRLPPPPERTAMPESVSPTSLPVQADAILQAHQLYCQLTGQSLRLGFDREHLWYELLRAGYSLDELAGRHIDA